tara:strand:- start:134 stop:481 length:348 start_codon:yes stop_codon:yes gene_type:complete
MDLTNKDAEQDTKLAVLESTVDNSVRRIEMVHKRVDGTNETLEELRQRVRKLEMWVAGAAAVISAAITVIGIAIAAEAKPAHAFTEDSLTGAPCATEVALSSVVEEVSIKEEEQE